VLQCRAGRNLGEQRSRPLWARAGSGRWSRGETIDREGDERCDASDGRKLILDSWWAFVFPLGLLAGLMGVPLFGPGGAYRAEIHLL